MQQVILAIDQGTTNSKAILLDKKGTILSLGSSPLNISYPEPGWVEQSADSIWASVVSAVEQCTTQAPPHEIAGIGISNQRESIVTWDGKTGKPLAPVITWQCRRTTQHTERLKEAGHEAQILATTGLPIDPLFPASKIHWLQNKYGTDGVYTGTVDSWLIWKLTNGERFVTDLSNASRTQLLNLKTGEWDQQLCNIYEVNSSTLAKVVDSKHTFGTTKLVPGLADGIPITAAMGDSHAALFGHAAFQSGDAKATFGTGSSVMMLVPGFSIPTNGMTTTIAWSIDGQISYALEGNILVSASLFPWLAELLGLGGDVDQLLQLAETVADSNGVHIVPALTGLGAPHWAPQARGEISGLSFASNRAHIAHAAALSMPLQVADVFAAMQKQSRAATSQVYVDGGPTKNHFLMQNLSNLLALPVYISEAPELSAFGAGLLAGLEAGFWGSLEDITGLQRKRERIEPALSEAERLKILKNWHAAVNQCIDRKSDTLIPVVT